MSTFRNLPPVTADAILTVNTVSDLPTSGVVEGAIRYVEDVDQLYTWDGAAWNPAAGGVQPPNPAVSTDNAIARWDGTDADQLKNSVVIIDDTGNITGVADLTATGDVNADNLISGGDVSGVTGTFTGTVEANAFEAGGFDGTEKALYSTAGKLVEQSVVTRTELEYLSGVTSAIQTQLNNKLDDAVSSTDNAVVRWDGATGQAVQNSVVTINDSGDVQTSGDISGTAIDATGSMSSPSLDLTNFTGGFALESSGTAVVESATSSTELGYLSGVTSAIQDQLDDKIDDSEKGANNGVATLDAGGKIPVTQLPNSIMEYLGTWAASTNTPTLTNGTGNAGDVYIASNAGTVNFGAGNITFAAGDWVVYSGTIWEKSINSNAVASVNGQTGAVVIGAEELDGSLITTAELNRLVGVTSDIQDQLDDKVNGPGAVVDERVVVFDGVSGTGIKETPVSIDVSGNINGAADINFSGIATGSGFNGLFALETGALGELTESATTATELGYLSGVTSSVQTQLDAKLESPMTTRGDLIRGGVGGVAERVGAATDNRVVRGDGTDVVSGQIDDPGFFTTGAEVTQSSPGVVLSAGQLKGTNTNDAASAGYVGESLLQSRVRSAAVSLTNTVVANVTTTAITLTPGDWDVSGMVGISGTSATVSDVRVGVSTTSATMPGADVIAVPTAGELRTADTFNTVTTTTFDQQYAIPSYRVSVSSSTPIYLVVRVAFSAGSVAAYGYYTARRAR